MDGVLKLPYPPLGPHGPPSVPQTSDASDNLSQVYPSIIFVGSPQNRYQFDIRECQDLRINKGNTSVITAPNIVNSTLFLD